MNKIKLMRVLREDAKETTSCEQTQIHIFQHSVVPVNDLICKGNPQDATSYHPLRLLVCYLVNLLQMVLL
jgi:hypothetical protein